MSLNQLVEIDNLSQSDIFKLLGQEKTINIGFPRLKINRMPDDDAGNTLPVGTYMIFSPDLGATVFGKVAKFRPFLSTYQYMIYDGNEKKFTNRSIQIKNFSEDAVDERGGLRCGKVSFKNLDSLSPEEKAKQKTIKCYRNLYGIVSISGVDIGGNSLQVSQLPCVWRLSGSAFNPIRTAVDAVTKRGLYMFQVHFNMTTKREVQGTTVWYTPLITIEDKLVPFTAEDKELLVTFQGMIDEENAEIFNLWEKNRNAQNKVAKPSKEIIDVSAALDADFNDSVDDVGTILAAG